MTYSDFGLDLDLVQRFGLNAIAAAILILGLYFRRYRDRLLSVTAGMFNVFAFGVLSVLSKVEFSLAAGFGLFAILALFSLRSEQIEKIEIAYFFGAIAIAVICSVSGTSLGFVFTALTAVLLATWALDHPRVMKGANTMKITLDRIDATTLSDPDRTRRVLSERLGVDVLAYSVVTMNFVNDSAQLTVSYRTR